jgi:hypothetical protein
MTRYTSCLARSAAVVAFAVGLGACSNSPFGPDEQHASMQVGVSAMTATTLGQTIGIDAAVVTAAGERIPNTGIHWELSAPGVVEMVSDGHFRVLHEGTVQVVAVWPKDPSVRALVVIKVDASILASACVVHTDQATSDAPRKCAQRRVVVSAATASSTLAAASSLRETMGARR